MLRRSERADGSSKPISAHSPHHSGQRNTMGMPSRMFVRSIPGETTTQPEMLRCGSSPQEEWQMAHDPPSFGTTWLKRKRPHPQGAIQSAVLISRRCRASTLLIRQRSTNGQSRPQICLQDHPSTETRLGAARDTLAQPVVCGHMSPFRAKVSTLLV